MTVRIGIAGVAGRMGREVAALARGDPAFAVVGGLSRRDPAGHAGHADGVPIARDARELLPCIDVLVDFTAPAATLELAEWAAAAGTPLVSGTTGLDDAQSSRLRAAAARIALFRAANMSPGINALLALLPALARALAGYDVEIIEAHHRHKADAPSGTALALARALTAADTDYAAARLRHGREGLSRREPGEIGVHAVRGGGNPGEHTVILTGDGEEVRLSHRAFSRAAYAEGALRAARLIVGQPPGWYEPATLPGFL